MFSTVLGIGAESLSEERGIYWVAGANLPPSFSRYPTGRRPVGSS